LLICWPLWIEVDGLKTGGGAEFKNEVAGLTAVVGDVKKPLAKDGPPMRVEASRQSVVATRRAFMVNLPIMRGAGTQCPGYLR
jgi:hypothetical protein